MKNVLIIFILIFLGIGGFLLDKQFSLFRGNSNFSTSLNKNESADPDLSIFRVEAKQFSFTPAMLFTKSGNRVWIYVRSHDVTHGFSLPEFGIDQRVEGGQEVKIEFVADHPGEFEFFNSIYSGEGYLRMRGKMVVE